MIEIYMYNTNKNIVTKSNKDNLGFHIDYMFF